MPESPGSLGYPHGEATLDDVQKLRKILRISALVLIVVLVIGGAFLGYLLTSNSYPRTEAEGWFRLKDLPRARGEGGSTFALPGPPGTADICPAPPCEPQFFIVGGLSGPLAKTVADVDILDAGTGSWREGPSLPKPRHHPAAASIGGAVYVSGGSKKALDWTPEPEMWVLRPGSDTWDPLPDMPEGRMGHAMLAIEGKLYVVGGRGESSNVLVYDLERGWTERAPMPGSRDHLAAVEYKGKIYAIGGRDDRVRTRVDIYDIAADAWSTGPDLPEPTSGMAAEVLKDGRIHVVGGEDPGTIGGGLVDRHYVLDPQTNTWLAGPRALLPVHGAASDQVAGILLISGGSRRQGAWSPLAWTGVTQRFEPQAGAPTSPTPTPSPSGTAPSPTPT
jgi:Kelch motif protein